MTTRALRPSGLIGRRRELELLVAQHRAALAGAGSIVAIAGEGGGGKTRLIAEFCGRIAPSAGRVAVAQCLHYIQLPYSPFLAVLSAYIEREPAIIHSDASLAAALSHLLPELQARSGIATPSSLDKLRQFNLMLEALKRYSADRPAIAVIEDVHWADNGTLELLQHVAPFIAESHILMILSYRSDAFTRNQPLRSTLARLERLATVTRIALRPLEAAQMRALLDLLNRKHNLAVGVINAIAAKAEGNPLFAEELFKAALEGADFSGGRLPDTLQEAVRERLQGLAESERTALIHAAAIGRRFKAEFVAEILGAQVEAITPALRHGIALELIREQSNGEVYYTFTHELTRQAAYGELLALEAQRLHKKIALALEASGADGHTTELAHHWWHAGDRARAARYNELAGDAAFAVFAFGDAATHYERALHGGGAQPEQPAALNEKLASALHQCGLGQAAKRAAQAALAIYERKPDEQSAARVCLMLARLCGNLGDTPGVETFANRALDLIQHDPVNPLFFDTHTELMRLYTAYRWDLTQAALHMDAAQRSGAERYEPAQIRFLELKSAIEACRGDLAAALADSQAAAATSDADHDVTGAIRCWGNFGTLMVQLGEREYAARGFAEAVRLIREQPMSGLSSNWTLVEFANANFLAGDLLRARDLIEEVLAAGIELQTFRLNLARAAIPVGLALDDEELVQRCAPSDLVSEALAASEPGVIGAAGAFAEYYAAQDLRAEAQQLLSDALGALTKLAAQPGPGDIDRFVLAVARHGSPQDFTRAREFLARILAAASVRSTRAFLALSDASALAKSRDPGAALLAVDTALAASQVFDHIGWPFFKAQALELADDPKAALALYATIGAVRDVKRLEAAGAPVRRARAKDELTTREREIYELLLAGRSNKVVATSLAISERTVENHVSSILGKFGVTSRAELIAKSKSRA